MKLRLSMGLIGFFLSVLAACGSGSGGDEGSSYHAGTGGLQLDVDEPEAGMGGTTGRTKPAASDAGHAGDEAGAAGDGGASNGPTLREELKPVLLYVASSESGKALFSWDMSNSETAMVYGPTKGDYGVDEFAVSPDGMRVAFINRTAKYEAGDVYLVNADGSNLKRLDGAVANIYPSRVSWSKGGKFVLYDTEDRDNPEATTVAHIVDAETGNPLAINGLLSPDEVRVASYEEGWITVQDIDGGSRIQLADSEVRPAALSWSPDGQMLSVWFEDIGESVFALNGRGAWGFKYCDRPGRWAPQGRWLAFECYQGEFFVQAHHEQPLLISAPDVANVIWRWAPDGSQIAVAAGDLRTYDLESGKNIRVNGELSAGVAVRALNWSPDGQYIAYGTSGVKPEEKGLFIAHPNGTGNVSVYNHTTSAIQSVVWSPDGAYIGYLEAATGGSWYVTSLHGESTFVGKGISATWSDDAQFFAVAGSNTTNSSIRVLRMTDKAVIAPDGPSDGQDLAFGLARR